MAAAAFASAPFAVSKTQLKVVGSAKPGPKQPPYAPIVLRAVLMHFEIHLLFALTDFVSAVPVLFSHFCSSFVGSVTGGNWASADPTISSAPAAPRVTLNRES